MPAAPSQSLWSATAAAAPAFTPLARARRVDVAIIGAGYTGLSAALHLAGAGREVLVLEAKELGERASGLNGGQVIAGLKTDPDALEELFGPERGARLVASVAAGPDVVFELIGRHEIDCDALRTGWIQPATSELALAQLARRAEQWWRRGAPLDRRHHRDDPPGAARQVGRNRQNGRVPRLGRRRLHHRRHHDRERRSIYCGLAQLPSWFVTLAMRDSSLSPS